jgi:probable phosphomutase (TIGR03848 family)
MPAAKAAPATTVILVRHGRTPTTGTRLPGRAPGLHLSDDGRSEADAVAGHIAALPRVDAIYTSPLERTRETATPIAKARGLRATVDRGLLECDYGDWTGAELKKLAKLPEWKTVQHHPSGFTFPGGESLAAMQLRVVACLRRLADKHAGGVVVVVSHADPIRAAVVDSTGGHLDQFQRVFVGTASVSAVSYGSLGSALLTLNTYGPLLQLGAKAKP